MTLEIAVSIATLVSILVGIYATLKKVTQTHELVNSRMTELLELTRTASRAEGMKEVKDTLVTINAVVEPGVTTREEVKE